MSEVFRSQRGYGESNLEFFKRIFGSKLVKDVAMNGKNEAYVIMGDSNHSQAYVIIMRVYQKTPEFDEVIYCVAKECENPTVSRCPRRIMEQLSPLETLYDRGTQPWLKAKAWRERCLKNLSMENPAKVKKDNIVRPIFTKTVGENDVDGRIYA